MIGNQFHNIHSEDSPQHHARGGGISGLVHAIRCRIRHQLKTGLRTIGSKPKLKRRSGLAWIKFAAGLTNLKEIRRELDDSHQFGRILMGR